MYVTYAMDAFSVGYQATEADSETASADKDFTAIGISYAVSEDMSVSYNVSEIEYETLNYQIKKQLVFLFHTQWVL